MQVAYLCLCEFGEIRVEIVFDSVDSPGKCYPSNEENQHEHIGRGGRHVHDLWEDI